MKMKAAIASLAVPVDSSTQLHLIESFVKYVEIERTTDSSGSAQDQIQENLHALLTSIPFKAVNVNDVNQLPAHERGPVELRTEELMLANMGCLPPSAMDFAGAVYPDAASS